MYVSVVRNRRPAAVCTTTGCTHRSAGTGAQRGSQQVDADADCPDVHVVYQRRPVDTHHRHGSDCRK